VRKSEKGKERKGKKVQLPRFSMKGWNFKGGV
jgi:hypothetical protein